MTKEYNTQVSEEIEGKVTEKLTRILVGQNHVFWVLCQNSTNFFLARNYGLAREPFRELTETTAQKTGNPLVIVPRTIPIPKRSTRFVWPAFQLTQTGRENSHVVTGVEKGIPFCSLETSSGKQKKPRSTSKPQFRSANTHATIEAGQIF